ncbi:MAG: Lacal_2735 family protein [Lewinellaceae bacterium]|nr:Lacal_2735 family protein [Lewinellaceae bacterium]
MFGLFKKDPIKKLEQQYEQLLEEAMQLQRKGDIKAYAAKTAEAEKVMDEIVALQKDKEAKK